MLRILLVIILLGLPAGAREFTSKDGRKIDGDLLAHAGDRIILRVGAKEFVVAIINFSPDDQQFIKNWIAENPGAVRYKFGFYFDLEKQNGSVSQGKAAGSMVDDKLKTIPYSYEMIVFNKEIADVEGIEIHYEIYIDDFVDIRNNSFTRMAVGAKKQARLETVAGKFEVPKIAAGGRVDFSRIFNTEFYIDRDGGRTDAAATDKVKGVRIRIYKGGKMIAEGLEEETGRDLKGVSWQGEEPTEGTVIK